MSNQASGQCCSIWVATLRTSGAVRKVCERPPGPPFSPRICMTPYLCGIFISRCHSWSRLASIIVITKSAPGSASVSSEQVSMTSPQSQSSLTLLANCPIALRASEFMSTRHSVLPANSRSIKMSVRVLGPKLLLPIPTMTILQLAVMTILSSYRLHGGTVDIP